MRKPLEQALPPPALQMTGTSFGENGPQVGPSECDQNAKAMAEKDIKAKSSQSPMSSAVRSAIAHSVAHNGDDKLLLPPKQCQSQYIDHVTVDRLNLQGTVPNKTDRDSSPNLFGTKKPADHSNHNLKREAI